MSTRFACGLLLVGLFVLSILSLFVFNLPWLALGGFALTAVVAAIFFFLCLED